MYWLCDRPVFVFCLKKHDLMNFKIVINSPRFGFIFNFVMLSIMKSVLKQYQSFQHVLFLSVVKMLNWISCFWIDKKAYLTLILVQIFYSKYRCRNHGPFGKVLFTLMQSTLKNKAKLGSFSIKKFFF